MSSGFSPISARRRVRSFTPSPASISTRVFDVPKKAALPALPLASTQNLTMTILLAIVLAGRGGDYQPPPAKKGLCHFRFDHVHQFLHRPRTLVQRRRLFGSELNFENLLDAVRADLAWHADVQPLDAVLAFEVSRAGQNLLAIPKNRF